MRRPGSAVGRVAALLTGLVVLAGSAGCTGSPHRRTPASSARPTVSSSPAATRSPVPPSAPLRVHVTHVAGHLGAAPRVALEHRVGAVVSHYLQGAFLGRYPRTDFHDALGAFTHGARALARRDEGLLTNRSLGATTRSVRATHRAAYLSVVAPHGRVAGVTAAIDVALSVDRGDRPGRRLHLAGRLLMTRTAAGGWAIFGYDLHRSQTPVRRAS